MIDHFDHNDDNYSDVRWRWLMIDDDDDDDDDVIVIMVVIAMMSRRMYVSMCW